MTKPDSFAFKPSKKDTTVSEIIPAQSCIYWEFLPSEIHSVELLIVPEIIIIMSECVCVCVCVCHQVYEHKTHIWDGNYAFLIKDSIMCFILQKHPLET